MRPAIQIHNLSKKYLVSHERQHRSYRTLRETLVDAGAAAWKRVRGQGGVSTEEFWALRDIDFDVQPGEIVGIIGRNGAGKSTLLKILSRITKPTKGRVELDGRVGSLLEVGTGFHPELTGRENIYLNGSILGMSKREIDRKFDEIVSFAEVEQFLDTPVKRYSSGMYVRLAFAVAAHLEPEILIIDEVLAVGDEEFQRKCLGKMSQIGREGRTVLFVSHNMHAVSKLTSRTVLIAGGRVHSQGPSFDVIRQYLNSGGGLAASWTRHEKPIRQRPGASAVVIQAIRCTNRHGEPQARFSGDEPLAIEIEFEVHRPAEAQIAYRLNSSADGSTIFTSAEPDAQHRKTTRFLPGTYVARSHVPAHLLVPGTYHLLVAANNFCGPQFDLVERALSLEVTSVGSLTSIERRLGVVAPLLAWETREV
jgi:lipopolysaccharide transport system ATP-binding protein